MVEKSLEDVVGRASGRQLASMMTKAVPAGARCVVELGAGTGAITRALIGHVASSTRLLIVEMNDVLHGVLRHRFPEAQVVCGDARHLEELLAQNGALGRGQVDAVISSLGLLAMRCRYSTHSDGCVCGFAIRWRVCSVHLRFARAGGCGGVQAAEFALRATGLRLAQPPAGSCVRLSPLLSSRRHGTNDWTAGGRQRRNSTGGLRGMT